jgi:RNA polymerase primary sigma factor
VHPHRYGAADHVMPMAEQLDWLIRQSRAYPLLTPQQEITLSRAVQAWLPIKDITTPTPKERAIQRRGKRAWDTFVMSNVRLVVLIAKKFTKRAEPHLTIEDLVQEGICGLQGAIAKFDPTRGYKFSTYAYWWIRQGINRAIENQARMIRIPCGNLTLLRKASVYCDEQIALTGRKPQLAEIAAHCGCTIETLKATLAHALPAISLDQNLRSDSGNRGGEASTYLDQIADEATDSSFMDEHGDLLEAGIALLHQLDPVDRMIIRERYMRDKPTTLREIGQSLGVSRERIRQREQMALQRMRLQLSAA